MRHKTIQGLCRYALLCLLLISTCLSCKKQEPATQIEHRDDLPELNGSSWIGTWAHQVNGQKKKISLTFTVPNQSKNLLLVLNTEDNLVGHASLDYTLSKRVVSISTEYIGFDIAGDWVLRYWKGDELVLDRNPHDPRAWITLYLKRDTDPKSF